MSRNYLLLGGLRRFFIYIVRRKNRTLVRGGGNVHHTDLEFVVARFCWISEVDVWLLLVQALTDKFLSLPSELRKSLTRRMESNTDAAGIIA